MPGHGSQKSPSVNNLISFWSDLEVPASAQETNLPPARFWAPQTALNAARPPSANITRNSGSTSSPALLSSTSADSTTLPEKPLRSRVVSSTQQGPTPTAASSAQNSAAPPPRRDSAPLFPLRSVAPVQSRVFGTQRHALDTVHGRPLSSPTQPHRGPGVRMAHRDEQRRVSSHSRDKAGRAESAPALLRPISSALFANAPPPSAVILKLAVIPPAQSKEETSRQQHHLARSHPMVSASEPLGRPVDALHPLVKLGPDTRHSSAAMRLDRIVAMGKELPGPIATMSHTPDIHQHSPKDSMQRRLQDVGANEQGRERTKPAKQSSRPTSEPITKPPKLSSATDSRWTNTSTDQGNSTTNKGHEIKSKGSEIMYAVVKGLPTKPAIPKLVGATGSGTVVIARDREDGLAKSGPSGGSESASGNQFRVNLISRNVDSRAARSDSQTTPNSKAESGSIPDKSKRESFHSFTSFNGSQSESMPEESFVAFDDRDCKEETRLLRELADEESMATNESGKNMTIARTGKTTVAQKYANGTPLGTKRSESSPEHSTLDSSDALFQPSAPLVSYPALDAYLSSLKPAQFPALSTQPSPSKSTRGPSPSLAVSTTAKQKLPALDSREGMFPPLAKVPLGVTLDQLKVNVTKPPGFFDQELQNVMLSSAIDGLMSGESSNIGISWMRLEIIRDFLQFVALYLSVSGNTFVNQKWLYATVNIIPALLSLDFPRAVGYGMVFLILFAFICWVALYTFKIMTRTDPNDDIEGLEVSSWSLRSKKQRMETISIVFLLTTLYLPLAKLSFDALVWSDTMWPVVNPYTNTDFPVLEPLGPSGIYRDPSDFCYVTSMKIQDLNFAYAIIPLAIFTLCANTLYFPLAIRRLVVLNLPRIDKYTEQGERRLDPDEEYKRLTNSDNCPYNFLYNGYRREFGTYKVVVMFNKLVAVIIVVLFSKDNCLFRGYERRTIEATRAGLQIVFTASLIFRHYRTQPFLYASQNLSEYWSRACTVATSVIGLFIVLNVGPLSVNALGILLVATYVLMCVIVIWFVIRQTQKFQVMLKQIQQRLDFSIEIFNPKLNYFKHIKRRIWQETWTTTLLVEDSFKMPVGKVVAYSQSPHRPPYLLNFTGTVAERHVENLRIVRHIGLRAYSQACQFLTPAIVRKRTLILKAFVGPDMYYAPEFMASNIKTYFGKAYVVPFPFSVVFVYDESSVVVTLVKEHDLDRYIQQNKDPEIERRRELRYQLRALDGKFVVRPFIETRGILRGRESNGTSEMSLANAPVSYKRGLFTIHRKKMSSWQGHNMNPGFSVTITYSDGEVQDPEGSSQLVHETTVGHDVIGITRDFQVTPALARLLRDNHALISRGVKKVKRVMQAYQEHYRNEAHRKDATLSYDFFINVYDNPILKHKDLRPLLLATEENPKVRDPSPQVSLAVSCLYDRMAAVNRTRCHQWWFLFWDDLYRKNHEEIPQLVPKEFSPAFPGSICYRPMARPELEKFLEQQGCWQKSGRAGFMHVGVLNRIYTFLNELVFEKMTKDQRQKQLELTTVERQRLENLFFVTKAKIHTDGTYRRMPLLDEYDEFDVEPVDDSGLKRKPSAVSRKKSKKGWFQSITPGRLRRQPSHHVESYSPGYIIPLTWHQKASQFAALLIGGRPEDMIGESDEEDDLEDSDEVALKRRKTSAGSEDTISTSESLSAAHELKAVVTRTKPDSNEITTERQNPLLDPPARPGYVHKQSSKDQNRSQSWKSSSTLTDASMEQGAQPEELVPLNLRQSLDQVDAHKKRREGQGRVEGTQGRDDDHSFDAIEGDSGMVSDTMSITSMSSEDYW